MQQPNKGWGALDEAAQQTLASLEAIRDHIDNMVEAARRQAQLVAYEIQAEESMRSGMEGVELTGSDAVGEQARGERRRQFLTGLAQYFSWAAAGGEALALEAGETAAGLTASFQELNSTFQSAQQSRALGLHVIRAQEEERRRLAREIHDGPTQLLNSVVLRMDVCQRFLDSAPERLPGELQQLKELVRLSVQDMRKIIFDLRPMTLDDLGVIPALRTFLKDYQARTGIETEFAGFGNERRYDPSFEVAVFRIVQEALTNVYKHAGATKVWIKVETSGGREIKVSVKDNGSGFDPEQIRQAAANGSKFGLVAMRERTELLGGSMDIQSAPGAGAKLSFVFTLPE